MFQDDNNEWLDDECPRCMVGRIQVKHKPFLQLYNNQLFTIPDGLCYECDVCGDCEFDYTNYDIIDKMLDSLKALKWLSTSESQTIPPIIREEDLSKQTKFPPA